MNKIYLIFGAGVIIFVFFAFWTGGRIASEKCRAEFAKQTTNKIIQTQDKIIKTKRDINAKTNNTDTIVIRDWLRANYTTRG